MLRLRPLLETVHLSALGVWAGAVAMTAATAAVIFPEMKALDPSLPEFSAYPGEHGIIAAGWVMARVFLALDWIQLVCGALAGATVLLIAARQGVRLRWVRVALTLAACGVLAWYLLSVAQPMGADLAAFYRHAQAGEVETANRFRDAFDARHPTASRGLGSIGLLALVALFAGGLSATARSERKA